MTRITWGDAGARKFSTGVDRGVLFVGNQHGVPWNGLVSVNTKMVGGESTPYYIDGVKYLNLPGKSDFEGSIEAYYSPPEFDECDGAVEIRSGVLAHQQIRQPFHFSYRTAIGNDMAGVDHGYKLHLVYNALAEPTDGSSSTMSQSVDADTLSWDFTSTPEFVPGHLDTAYLTLDSTIDWGIVQVVEHILYGTDASPARMPTPTEILGLQFAEYGITPYGTSVYYD